MGSLFGGAQTVPQTQSTTQNSVQNANQSGTQASTQAYAANPFAAQAGQWTTDWLNAMRSYTGQFSQPVPGLNVAALTPEQQSAITGITNQGADVGNNLLSSGQNYLGSGWNLLNQAGQGITANDINSFYNPMAGNITANLQDIFNQQALAARVGGTSATGGVGGDRAAVAQALLGKQQGLAAGQTYAGLWQSALQAAQQQKAQQSQTGAAMAGYGIPTIQAGFGALGQGLQAASIPQAQQQAVNQALYQQQLGEYQDPFLRYSAMTGSIPTLAGLGGVGTSATNSAANISQTGIQSGTGAAQTTYPAPPVLSQVAGLGGLALGAGMLFSDKRGKTDIQKMGKDKRSGLPLYAYRYKGDPKTYPKVVGPMAQDIKKKYPGAVKELARGGGIQRFQDGGADDSYGGQQQQDTNYFDDYTDSGGGQLGGGQTAPYQGEGATWDPKRIFSPDRLQKAQRAIGLAQKAAQQSQIARPRVAPITFPQVPWKSGITFAKGGRIPRPLAINVPALQRAIAMRQQEGGRVDAATAESWGGHKVWRPGIPKFGPVEDRVEGGEQGMAFAPDKGTGVRPNYPMRLVSPPMRTPDYRSKLHGGEGVYRFGGKVRGYDDGGFVDPLEGLDEFATGEPEPPGLPEYADMPDTGDDSAGAIPLPPRPPAGMRAPAGGGAGFGAGAAPAAGAGGMTMFGKPVSPGAMALIQGGLGMLAASGQRDARGLPMSGLAAIGKGGAMGMETFQDMTNQQNKDKLARDTLAQRNMLAQQSQNMRQQAIDSLERHRLAQEANLERHREYLRTVERRRPVKMDDPNTGEQYLVRPDTGERIVPPQDPYAVPPASAGPGVIEAKTEKPQTEAAGFSAEDEGDQEYLASLPEERRAYLKKINNGELPLPPRSKQTIPILNQLSRAYPGYDATIWKSRNETRAAFAKGVEGRSVTALGTLAGHLNDFMETSQKLAKGNVKAFNKVENAVRDQLGGEALADYRTARTAVADELARVFQGAGAVAEAEKDRWLEALDDAKTPEQMRRVIGRLTSLVDSRMKALGQTYDRGMNYRPDNPKSRVATGWLEGEPKDKFDAVKKWSTGAAPFEEGAGAGAGAGGAKPTISSKEEYDKLPSGTEFIMNGKPYRKP